VKERKKERERERSTRLHSVVLLQDHPIFTINKKSIGHMTDALLVSIFSYLDFTTFTRMYDRERRVRGRERE